MERISWTIAHELGARGHDVTVATTAHPDGRTGDWDGPVRVRYMTGTTWRRYQDRWWRASYSVLREEHRADPFDVILSQSAGGLGYVAAAARDLSLPSAVLFYGSAASELRTAWRSAPSPRGVYRLARLGWRLPRQLLWWRRAAPSVACWMALSSEVAADNRREIGIPDEVEIAVVPVGVDTDRFHPDPEARVAERARLGLPLSVPLVVLATRLEREKGVHVALDALASLRKAFPGARMLVAGRGHHEAALRARAHRRGLDGACSFLGLVDHDRLPRLLAAADAFVLPSLCAEARPASVVEASATGLPVVATDSAGTRESVVDGVTGLLVRRGDATALAAALTRLLGDDRVRAEMAANGRRIAVEAWSRAVTVDAVEAVLQEAAALRHRAR